MLSHLKRGFFKPLLFVCIILIGYACQNNEGQVRITHYELPIGEAQDVRYSKAFINDNSFYGYNRNSHGIDLIKIDSSLERPSQQLVLFDKEGPEKVGVPENIFTYKNHLYVLDIHDLLVEIDLNTFENQKYQLAFERNGDKLMTGKGMYFNKPRTLTQFEQYVCIPLYKTGYKNGKNYYDSLYVASINLENYEFELLSFAYPPEFKEYYWPVHDDHYVQQISKNQYVIAFKGIAALFLSDKNGSLTKVSYDLQQYDLEDFSKPAPRKMTQRDANKNLLYLNGNQYFSPVYFNPKKKCLYRVAKGQTDEDSFNQTKELHLFKYDLNLDIIDHAAIPQGLLPNFLSSDKGPYFQHSLSQIKNEELFNLSLFSQF